MQRNEAAARIWPVLSYAATHRQTLTYETLGQLIGLPAVAASRPSSL